MNPIRITVTRNGHELVAYVMWTDVFACYVGWWEILPEMKRTGHAPGAVLDGLCEIEDNAIGAAFGIVFGS
jgi:hypothetical protein